MSEDLKSGCASFEVGVRLRFLRDTLGVSQRELARRAGITNANLSMIEQGKVSPSINTLEKILQAMPLSLENFFNLKVDPQPVVIRRELCTQIRRAGSEYQILPLGNNPQELRFLARHTLSVGSVVSGAWFESARWLCGLVQTGDLTLMVDPERYLLAPGDAFQLHLGRAHSFANQSNAPVTILLYASSIPPDFLQDPDNTF